MMDMDELGIFFSELTPAAQRRVLKFYRLKDPQEMNWDLFPLFILSREPTEVPRHEDE